MAPELPHPAPLATPEGVRRVTANPDPVSRNLQITLSYHQLAVALDRLQGGSDLPWCAFATWASKQAGQFIRNDVVPPHLRRLLGLDGAPRPWWKPRSWLVKEKFLRYARMTAGDVSAHVAEGNRLVYAKLAPLFAELLELAAAGALADPATFDAFLARLAAAPDTTEALPRAFESLRRALDEREPEARAERLFLSNLLVGWHEQIRLQEAIDGALSAPVRRALADPERSWFSARLPLALRLLGARLFRLVLAPAIRSLEDDFQRAATECLITLGTPDGRVPVGRDLAPLPGGRMFPEPLERIALAEAAEALAELDRTADTTAGSAARDWASLGDRMNFIADYFRSRARERSLLEPPFSPSQAAAIRDGAVPPGPL